MVFAVSADPFFCMLADVQEKFEDLASPASPLAAFRGCADDIGGVFSSYKLLKLVEPIFQKAQDYGGLTLNVKKRAIIPTAFKNFEETKKAVKEWLAIHIPKWADFKVVKAHPYLGPAIGPSAGDSMWDKPIAKYWSRILRISACGFLLIFPC